MVNLTNLTPSPSPKERGKVKERKHRSYSVKDIYDWKFEDAQLSEKWAAHLGALPVKFSIYVDGEAGEGKTEYSIQMAKEFAQRVAKVRIVNVELGKHKQVSLSFKRNRIKEEVKPARLQYDVITNYEALKEKISKPNSGGVIIIDSISFFPLDEKQVQELLEKYKGRKSFVFIAYRAHFSRNKAIRHLCDIKINVNRFVATIEGSRFGGTDYFIWPEKYPPAKVKPLVPTLFDQKEVSNG